MNLFEIGLVSLLSLASPLSADALPPPGTDAPAHRVEALYLPGDTLVISPDTLVVSPDTLPGVVDGRREAQDHSTRSSFLRGVGWGTVLGPAGGIIAMRLEQGRDVPTPESTLEGIRGRPSNYQEGFVFGWQDEHLTRRRESSVMGSMVGTIAFLAILITVMDLGQTEQSVLPPEANGMGSWIPFLRGGSGAGISIPLGMGGR